MAGVQTAVRLRERGWSGAITLVGAEPHRPYDRPPLSKAVLTGKADAVSETAFEVDFDALDVELLLGRSATGLRADDREVDTDAGPLPYDHLVLATGAEPIPLPGTEGTPGVHLLRTLDDAERLRPVLAARRHVVAVGAGWIGAEFATAAREAGCRVTVVEAADRPLAGVLPPEVADHMRRWYAEAGVELVTGRAVTGVRVGDAHPCVVELADGSSLPAWAVVVGIGARPATGWLAGSGPALGEDGSVLVDDRLRTSLPDVYAVGDCASFPSARYGRRLLVHHWDNALQAPRTVASLLVGGEAETPAYDPVPYFWSEQFGRFVQYAGHHDDRDEMLWRGDPEAPSWSVCWLRDGVLNAVLAVGRPRDIAQGRKLIERAATLDPVRAADPSVPLKSAVRS
ncbi:NAD(P)/FAD-dependent oxidoreductase [Streptomyces megasporus]|uniref:NAD(P)/FAD-dependent oxidoreductase n=1 Tax=Streptomyces megasporus TaxID=44060 RepID=UPI001FE21D52|nr:FAD-dependent oxidoreductase [Streptomyces megasporus]